MKRLIVAIVLAAAVACELPTVPAAPLILPAVHDVTFRLDETVWKQLPKASGGKQPYTYGLYWIHATEGEIPGVGNGLSYNEANRTIFGVPGYRHRPEDHVFKVTDAAGTVARREFTIEVK